MEKIDIKDRKILYQLDLNCRQSNTQIGKKVGLKKDVVAYRIKRMQDEGIIKTFWTAINTFKLGYNVYRIYVNFDYVVRSEVKDEIIQHFNDYRNSWAVLSVQGPIDFDAVIWVKDVFEFYKFWDKTLEKYEDYFAKYAVSFYIKTVDYTKSYLITDENVETDRIMYTINSGGTPIEIDEIDYKLLNELAINARVPLIELAKKLKCSSQTVNYRINNLVKKGIIKAFRVYVDYSKIGLQNITVDIYLKKYKQKNTIIKHIQKNPNFFCLNIAVGWADLTLEFAIENMHKLMEIMEDLDSKFPGSIKKHDLWLSKKVHKERWLPELF
ncbi:MAG: winged helix-turn-helix transcriptional regulator [Candidatus Hodarchaeota archaeon]